MNEKQNFDLLTTPISDTEIEFRVEQIREYNNSVYAILIPYKTARVDMLILDMACGQFSWQNEFKRDSKGVLQCGIGIKPNDGDWIWKWSNGTPSQFESEKGEYSDAFKRAGFMWGIGRELYDFPRIKIVLNEKEFKYSDGRYKASGYLKVNEWTWDINEDQTKIVAKDFTGNERFNSNPYKK